MSKLPEANKFIDVSDYGRPVAKIIAKALKSTAFTPIHVTLLFIVSGLLAIVCILESQYWLATFFLILKSILDAADGELARVKDTPSYTGRFLDSVADILLNFLILLTIRYITDSSWLMTLGAFVGIQLQGTLYNYYYVILRNKFKGDTTSRVYEKQAPKAFPIEKQQHVDILFFLYNLLYRAFDKTIYLLDPQAEKDAKLPNWFMTVVSSFGLGFQLLTIGIMLVVGLEIHIIPLFLYLNIVLLAFIVLRRSL
ncbi:MAG: CDP-diacylglycerol--serine O-phosphatidyltransferase [Arcticibacterium sp.]|jgi:CDP-diacylglycerol--serine O-phosphatidyltransferase